MWEMSLSTIKEVFSGHKIKGQGALIKYFPPPLPNQTPALPIVEGVLGHLCKWSPWQTLCTNLGKGHYSCPLNPPGQSTMQSKKGACRWLLSRHRFSCLLLPQSSGLRISTCFSVLSQPLRDTLTERKSTFGSHLLLQNVYYSCPWQLLLESLLMEYRERRVSEHWHMEMYSYEGTETENKCISAMSIIIPIKKYWLSHPIP